MVERGRGGGLYCSLGLRGNVCLGKKLAHVAAVGLLIVSAYAFVPVYLQRRPSRPFSYRR